MSLFVRNIDELPRASVDQSFTQLAQLLQEAFPNMDTRRGVIGDLMLQTDAIFDATQRLAWERLRQSLSLKAIQENPALASDDVVDRVLSNWGITRGTSLPARGEITIVLNRPAALTITTGTRFVTGGRYYRTEQAFTARSSASNVYSANDRLLMQTAADRWAFTVAVVAEEPGTEGLLQKDTAVTPLTATVAFVRAYATNDFVGATDALTNEQMLERQRLGIANRSTSNRTTTASLLQNNSDFAGLSGVSIIGAGDTEMRRDRHTIIPISNGGCTDIYVRTRPTTALSVVQKTATLLCATCDGGVWQIAIENDEFPGFYEVLRIEQLTGDVAARQYSITGDVRDISTSGIAYVPDIIMPVEGAYSAYQTAVIQFLDPDTSVSGMTEGVTTRDYAAVIRYLPLIREIQEYIGSRDIRDPGGDHLVRAAVPCFTRINVTISHTSAINPGAIASAVANYVNGTAFTASLYASALVTAIRGTLPAGSAISNIDMLGRIRAQDGSMHSIRDRDMLTIPSLPDVGVTPRTTCFFLNPDDVVITSA